MTHDEVRSNRSAWNDARIDHARALFKAVKPEVNVTPTQKYATFVLGEIKMADKTWEALQPHFRKGVIQWLNEKKAFENNALEIEKRTGLKTKIYAVNDKSKHDPEKKSSKAKPGKPGIYLE